MQDQAHLYLGLMSGTSVDSIDCALVRRDNGRTELLATHAHTIPDTLKARIAAICEPGDNEIQRMGELDRALGTLFGEASLALLASASVDRRSVRAIGSHGQTIRHAPPSSAVSGANSFTLQIADPNTIAEITGICTVADFRRRDVAAGGEGAPLAPAFHAAAFASEGKTRAIVNIGGIANATLLQGSRLVGGFDTGPGNTLLDQWIREHQGSDYDVAGMWAASGASSPELLATLNTHPYFDKTGPRSTGREAFNMAWLRSLLSAGPQLTPADVQATLAEFTAQSIFTAVDAESVQAQEVYLCGGGAHNDDLVQRIKKRFAPRTVDTTLALGMHPDWVEAVTFAWLADQTLCAMTGSAAQVTGARGERILGGIYQA